MDFTQADPQDYLDEDPELENLRRLYRQKMGRMAAFDTGSGAIPTALGGLIDAYGAGQKGFAAADAIATGKPVSAVPMPSAADSVQRALAAKREKALNDVTMFKSLEDLARRKQEKALEVRRQDLDRQSKDLYYKASLGDKEAARQLTELLATGKITSAEKIADARTQAELEKQQKEHEFKGVESEKERQNRLELEKIRAANRAKASASAKAEKPPTADQSKAAGFARRLEQSEQIFKDLAASGKSFTDLNTRVQRALPEFMGGMKDPALRQQEQAERNFVNSVLRRESGAAISPSEFASAEKQYFPRPGDDPATLAQKAANRAQAIENIKAEAAGAYAKTPFVSPPKAGVEKKKPMSFEEWKKAGKPKR